MRSVRAILSITFAVGIAVTLVAFRLQGGVEAPAQAPGPIAAAPPVEVEAPPDQPVPIPPVEPSAVHDAPQPTLEQLAADEPRIPERSDRDRWGRNRNRYPGPIPTPAEWEPPSGPVRIALQAGHWRSDEAPSELSGLRDNGTAWREVKEWEVNLTIARRAAVLLEALGYEVDVLPSVVPPGYRAHLFIAIHADGSADPRATGFRVAAPRRDATGRAQMAVELLERTYAESTGLKRLTDITRRMSSYYAFNYRRYEHALHPMTIGMILETGFLSSPSDREIILNDPERSARGIVDAIVAFPPTPPPSAATTTASVGSEP